MPIDFQEEVTQTDGIDFQEDVVPPSLSPAIPAPGQMISTQPGVMPSPVPQAFPTEQQRAEAIAAQPALTAEEAERLATTPFASLPRVGEPGTPTRALSEIGAGLVEQAFLTPASGLLATTMAVPGVRPVVGAVLAASAAKAAAQKLGESSVTGNKQTLTEGLALGGLSLLGAAGTGVDIARTSPGVVTKAMIDANTKEIVQLSEEFAKPIAKQLPAPRTRMPEFQEGPIGPEPRTVAPESRQLPAPRTAMPEFTESTLEPGGPPLRALPAPGESGATVGVLPESPLAPRTAGYRITLPAEPATVAAARQVWSKPIDVEAQVTGADAIRQLASLTEERKTPGQPYEPPTISTDLRQLERMMQRNSVSKVESWADEVLQRKQSELSANAFLDPEFLAAASVKGAILVKRGVVDLAEWSNEMRKQFGRGLDDKLPEIYRQAMSAYAPAASVAREGQGAAPSVAPPPVTTTDRIRTAIKEQDVMPGRDWFTSPEFEFRKIPEADRLVTMGVEANLLYKSKAEHTSQLLETFRNKLSEPEQKTLTKALFGKEKGDANAIASLPPGLQESATAIRGVYDKIRARVIETKQDSIKSELSGPQLNAMQQVLDGMSLEDAAKANGLRSPGRLIVQSALDEIKELEHWGIEDYTTHIERGSYRVVTPDGTTIAIGETKTAAALKANRWLKENPGQVEFLTIDDSFASGAEFPTKLSRGQYFRLVQRLKDNLGETAEDIQRILHENGSIVAVKPTNKYAAALQQRRNILKGEENVFDVLPGYVFSMEKKLGLDPVLKEARKVLSTLPENAKPQIEKWLDDLKGQKTIGDRIADYLLGPLGLKPFAYSRVIQATRNLSTHLKLGYRPVAAVVNRTSGLHHTWTKTSTKYLQQGREWLKTDEGKAEFQASKPFLGIEASFVGESGRPATQEAWYSPLGMFQAAERVNRPEAFGAFVKFAQSEFGMKMPEATQYARKAVRQSQFIYDMASLPRMMRGPTGKLLFQFKPYLVKELEFISSLRGAEIPRYLLGFLAIGGPRAALYTLKSLPIIGLFYGFDKLEDWLNQEFPRASRGIGGMLGVDVSPTVAFQLPQTVPELLGPVISDMSRLFTEVISPALQGEKRDWSDVGSWALRLAPALNYWSQIADAVFEHEGWITNKRGELVYKPTGLDYAKMAIGAKPLEKSIQEVEERFLKDQETINRKNKTRLIDEFLKATKDKDAAAIQELIPELREAGITAESIRSAAKQKALEPNVRLLKGLSKPTRAKEAERFQK